MLSAKITADVSVSHFTVGRLASLACLIEATAPKPGNVHRGADFEDLTFPDFVVSAEVVGYVIDRAEQLSVGDMVLEIVRRTKSVVGTNTNLGIALLFSVLAKCITSVGIDRWRVRQVLDSIDEDDSTAVYQAIRIAKPAGLGTVDRFDVYGPAPFELLDAMRLASDRDLIARQYVSCFNDVFDQVTPLIVEGRRQLGSLSDAIVFAQLSLIARHGDSLIHRKCGQYASDHARFLADKAIKRCEQGRREDYVRAVGELDFWMRSDGHRRNPGTTADLIAAGLFVGLASRQIAPPYK
jgi:triphosphoribosyl-dephospho-CoA synthase